MEKFVNDLLRKYRKNVERSLESPRRKLAGIVTYATGWRPYKFHKLLFHEDMLSMFFGSFSVKIGHFGSLRFCWVPNHPSYLVACAPGRAVRTSTAGMALAVPLFFLKKGKKHKLLINNFVIIVPSTCYTNSNLIFEKSASFRGHHPWPPLLTVPLLNSFRYPWLQVCAF